MSYDFLVTEAQKILFDLEPLFKIFRKDFINAMVADLIKLASLIMNIKNPVKDEDVFFMTITLFVLHQEVNIKEKDRMCELLNDFSGIEDVKTAKKTWPKIKKFFPGNVDIESLSLPSLSTLKNYDNKNGTSHFDLVRTNFSTFVQCLIKADGKITKEEKKMEKKINRILFPFGKPHKKKEDNNISFILGGSNSGVNISYKKGKSGVTLTIGGDEDSESESIAQEKEISAENLDSVINEINSLIGLVNIKKQIKTLINLIKIKKERKERGMPETELSLHSVFYGPPGTGKTTVARLLGRVYKSLGLLEKGHVVETDRAGLVAGFVGQTAIQTDKIIKQAMDGILFIDEAYALKGNDNDFGNEAIDTILKRMEDNRGRFVVIVAGYPDEMEGFIASNPGLKSRFSRYFYFKDYSSKELVKIFIHFCTNAALKLTKPAEAKLLSLFQILYENKDKSFGNGRLARNLFEKIIENQANRLVEITPLTDEVLSTICKEDIPDTE